MGEVTGIPMYEHTFNPWWGCEAISPGCENCYAEKWARRCGRAGYYNSIERMMMSEHYWAQPVKWDRAAREAGEVRIVMCGSMCDVFEDNRALDAARIRLFKLIQDTPNLFWMFVTKRPENARKLLEPFYAITGGAELPRTIALDKNMGIMATVEEPDQVGRVAEMMRLPWSLYAVSHEPALGAIDWANVPGADKLGWIVTGGESGKDARPMHPDWARADRDFARKIAASFFFKQWGEWCPGGYGDSPDIYLASGKIHTLSEREDENMTYPEGSSKVKFWQEHHGVAEDDISYTVSVKVGVKAAGHMLDRKIYQERPDVGGLVNA